MRRSLGFAIAAIVTLAACSSLTYSDTRLDAIQTELNRRYGLWRGEGITSYEYLFSRTCSCDSSLMRPVIVTVADTAVISVTYADSGRADSGTAVPDSAKRTYLTVEQLFYQIQIAINLRVDSLGAAYDQTLNYPTRIVIDQDFRQLGDELSLFASNLKPKQP